MSKNTLRGALVALIITCSGLLTLSVKAFENVNMNPTLSVEGGQVVVRWGTRGFDHYNIRWSENGGPTKQVERAGDKDFRYLSTYRPGVVYSVAVQGCDKSFGSSSQCTSWDEVGCGPDDPCDGSPKQSSQKPSTKPGSSAKASDVCVSGFVWREAAPKDLVCVTPASRELVAQENRTSKQRWNTDGAYGVTTCVEGYVWREAFNGDVVCVSPQRRDAVRKENQLAASRRVRP